MNLIDKLSEDLEKSVDNKLSETIELLNEGTSTKSNGKVETEEKKF